MVILSWVGSESWQAELLPHTNTCQASELTGRRAAAAGAECSSVGGVGGGVVKSKGGVRNRYKANEANNGSKDCDKKDTG